MVLEIAIVIGITGLALVWYCCRPSIARELKGIEKELARLQKRPEPVRVQKLLRRLYALIQQGIAADNAQTAYQGVELLRLAFGSGLVRPDEAARLMALSMLALNGNKADIATFCVDAFRPLTRQLPDEQAVTIVNQLTLIAVIALRKKQNFLADKVIACIFYIIEQPGQTVNNDLQHALLRSLRTIGVLSLRRRDEALFREIITRTQVWLLAVRLRQGSAEEMVHMLTAWLYRIVGIKNEVLFGLAADNVLALVNGQVLHGEELELLFEEWGNIGAIAALNPNSRLAALIMECMFNIARYKSNHLLWTKALAAAERIAAMAVARRGLLPSFAVIYPLFECGRKLLQAELRRSEELDASYWETLLKVMRKCIMVLEYGARQNLLGNAGESLIELCACWLAAKSADGDDRTIRRYCQLLMMLWLDDHRKARKKIPAVGAFLEPLLFSPQELKRICI